MVKVGQFTSNSITLNVGAPQGCVLSPLLYSLYTHYCVSSHSSTSIIKFADDTVALGLISNIDETAFLDEVERLTSWCQDNCLSLNVFLETRTRKCVSASTWTAACEAHRSKLADTRLVITNHFSWAQWGNGWETLTSYRLKGPTQSHPSPAGLRFPHARQGHRPPWLKWTGCPWIAESDGPQEPPRRTGELQFYQAQRDRASGTTDVPADRQRGGTQGDEQAKGLQPGRKQQVSFSAWCI